jgi:hypothetical protein
MPTELEVRRCKGCGQPAVLSGVAWQHSHFGMNTGIVTQDCRCQSCGRKFKIRPRPRVLGYTIAGVLLIPTCVGLPILAMAYWMYKQDDWNPVVPGALPPPRKFRAGAPLRKCGDCGSIAVPRKVTQNRVNGIPAGVEVEYLCQGCNDDFTIESLMGQVMNMMSGGVVAAIGLGFLLGADHLGWKYGGAAVAWLGALFMFGLVLSRLLARIRNPVQPDGLAE